MSAKSKTTLLIGILCFCIGWAATNYRYPKVVLPQEKNLGVGVFHIEQVKNYSSPFNRSIQYRGTLKHFQNDSGEIFSKLPCCIYFPPFGKRPAANTDYEIRGILSQKSDFVFVLKPEKKTAWKTLPSFYNLSQWRYDTKHALFKYLKKEIPTPQSQTFLNALATGDVDERILSMEFGKVGLQHVLAISGFHFAFVALLLHFLLRLLFPLKISWGILLLILSFYYLFLGNTPSIQRAYIAIVLFGVGRLFSLKISGLNALGAGLIAELILNPLNVTYLSFQLTFLCTIAILLFYPLMHRLFCKLLPIRTADELKEMPLLDKHGYLFSSFLRKILSLNFTVHLVSLPVILHLFHKFPLLSMGYNLFFPTLVFLTMLLLFFALLAAPIFPFLSHAIHGINDTWTSVILNLTTNPPATFDFVIRSREISFEIVICTLTLLLFFGIVFHKSSDNKIPL